MTPKIAAIVAFDSNRIIGINGQLPWKIPEDMKRFVALTTGHTVLMGRKTYESIPKKFRPLSNRLNVVVTRNPGLLASEQGILVCSDALDYIRGVRSGKHKIQGDILWVVGGGEIYSLTKPYWDEIAVTLVEGTHQGDAYFPEFKDTFNLVSDEAGSGYRFQLYVSNDS